LTQLGHHKLSDCGDIQSCVAVCASDRSQIENTLKFRSAGRADYYGVGIDSGREIGEA
jgi:hypothetical protein